MQAAAIAIADEPIDAEVQAAAEQEADQLRDRLSGVVGRLRTEAKRRVDRRVYVERRWIQDLQQYHGIYPDELQQRLNDAKGSKVFANLTRAKTNAMIARLMDLLFPTDDRNWQIDATPVPKLSEDAEVALAEAARLEQMAAEDAAQADMAQEDGNPDAYAMMEAQAQGTMAQARSARAAADELQGRINEAQQRARLMQEEIDDQLKTCRFQAEARDMIEDACKIGAGVLKGPILGSRIKRQWMADPQTGEHMLVAAADAMPAAIRVDPWAFFPDPDARRPEDSEGFFERHLMTKKQLRELALRDDIDADAVRELMRRGPDTGDQPGYLADLTNITDQVTGDLKDYFHVWEYTGPLDAEDLEVLALAFNDDALMGDLDEIDPLSEIHARIWFCDDYVLSFALHPLDSNDPIYSVFNLERDETSLFGFGIPYLMRDEQSILNAGLRMMMDNAALAVGPQIVINKDVVEPQDGIWSLMPRKLWLRKGTAPSNQPPFETYNVPMNQEALQNIIAIARQSIDEVTSMPQIAQGEQGSGVTKTAQGMALLMNSANVIFRRVVKNFDDDVTVPLITRFYDWNMQFSDKPEIKGDYDVVARGSSVLLVREMQANNLMLIAQAFGDHPKYGDRIKDFELLQAIFRAHMMGASEVLRTDSEYEKHIKQKAGQSDPQMAALQAEQEIKQAEMELRREEFAKDRDLAEMEWNARSRIAEMQFEARMQQVAEALNMKRSELDAKLAMHDSDVMEQRRTKDEDRRASERRLAAEVAVKQQTGDSSGGAI